MRSLLLALFLGWLGCQPKPIGLPPEFSPAEAKLQRDRFEQISFEHPDNWSVERVPSTDASLSIVGGLSPDNKSLFLFVALKNSDPVVLREADLVQLAKEKFFNNAEPVKLVGQVSINNLTGTQAEFVSTLGNSVVGTFSNNAHRALLYAAYHQSTAFVFIVATEERAVEEKNEQLLKDMLGSLRGEGL